MLRLLSTILFTTAFVAGVGAYFTFNSNAAQNVESFGQFSSDMFKEAIRQGYRLVSEHEVQQQNQEDLDEETPTERSGILPGEIDTPPQNTPAPDSSSAQAPQQGATPQQEVAPRQAPSPDGGDSTDPNASSPETDGEGPNPPPTEEEAQEDEALRAEEERARQRIAEERARQEAERQKAEAQEAHRKQAQLAQQAANTVRDYYHLLAQGDYQNAWGILAPSFKSRRSLDLDGYECFWRAHQPFLRSVPKTVSVNKSHATVYTDWKITHRGQTIYNEPVKVSLVWDTASEGWLISSVESRLYSTEDKPTQPPREHMRPASVNIEYD